MSNINEKSAPLANGLTITRPVASRQPSNQSLQPLTTIEDVDSTHSLSPTHSNHNNTALQPQNSPLSPFYNPNPSRQSIERNKSESRQEINIIPKSSYDTDVEACLAPQKSEVSSGGGKPSLFTKSHLVEECTVWPGQKAMKMKKKAMRRERGKDMVCGCMAGLNKKTKIWIKILIALLVIGIGIAVGLGVSKAVGGGVWKDKSNSNAPIDQK